MTEVHESAGSALNIDLARLPSSSQQRAAPNNGGDVLNSMLKGCEKTLKHLEKLVEKYSSIRKSKYPDDAPIIKKWRKELKDNWKKVAWTTEGGDLATLRSQLTLHPNNLNLVLAVIS